MARNFSDKLRKIRYGVEFAPMGAMLGMFSLMSPPVASRFAGFIGRKIGPRLGASHRAMANLKMALPGREASEYKKIITGMWENLARVMAEYQDLEFYAPDVEVVGAEDLKDVMADGPVIFISGHIGNWEVAAPTMNHYGVPVDLVYRPPNNPWADKILNHYRSLKGKLFTIPKSQAGTRLLVERLREGHSVGILIDQKYNEGLAVPFFCHPAMTSPAFVQLSQKYDCPLIPFRVERLEKSRFRLSFYDQIPSVDEQGENLPVEDVIAKAHGLLESWISERPEQWLWLHRRWIDQKKPGKKVAAKLAKADSAAQTGKIAPSNKTRTSPAGNTPQKQVSNKMPG